MKMCRARLELGKILISHFVLKGFIAATTRLSSIRRTDFGIGRDMDNTQSKTYHLGKI
jgi:hypothetical protein